MSKIITKFINDSAITADKIASGAVTDAKLASSAKQSVLESKLSAERVAILSLAAANASSQDVSTEVLAAATVDTPRTALTAKGIYVGAVSGANDIKKVLIREAGKDNGISDGAGDEVYGVLSEDTGVFTLSFKKADGSAHTMAGTESLDIFFVEIFDMFSKPVDSALGRPVAGVIDATQASALNNHLNDSSDAHDASAISAIDEFDNSASTNVQDVLDDLDSVLSSALSTANSASSSISGHLDGNANKHDASEIDYERADGSKKNIAAASDSIDLAIDNLDDAIGSLAASPSNYTPVNAAIVASHLAAIDTALASAGGTSFSDDTFEIKDNSAPTKKIAFQVAGVTAGNTRVISAADRDVNLSNITEQKVEVLTLSAGDITAKYKDLAVSSDVKLPSSALLLPQGGIPQKYTTDFTIISDGSIVRRINWSGLGLDGVLEENDVITVIFQING